MVDFETRTKLLANRIANGDEDAAQALWVELIPVAKTAVCSLIRHDGNREDVLQDVLLEVPKYIAIYLRKTNNERKLGGFFYRAFRFEAFNASRRIRYRRAVSLEVAARADCKNSPKIVATITSDHPTITPFAECFECGVVFTPKHPAQIACSAVCYGKIRVRAVNITSVANELEAVLNALCDGDMSHRQLEQIVSSDAVHMRLTILRAIGYGISFNRGIYSLQALPLDNESLIARMVRWQAAGCLVPCWVCGGVYEVVPHHPKSCCSASCRQKLRRFNSTRTKIAERKASELDALLELLKLGPATKQKLQLASREPVTQVALLRALGCEITFSDGRFRLITVPSGIDFQNDYADWLEGVGSGKLACIVCNQNFTAKKRDQPSITCGPTCSQRLSKSTKSPA